MRKLENVNETIFESIKHIDEYGNEIGMLENFKKYWIMLNGVNLKV